MNIGKGIKIILERKGMSQKDLAEKTNISETSISQLIRNKNKPRKETLNEISRILNISPELLVLLSIDKSDVPKEREGLYNSLWPFIEKAILELFGPQEQK